MLMSLLGVNLRQLLLRLLNLGLILLPGYSQRFLKGVNIIQFLLAEIHFLVCGFEDFVHFVLMILDHLKGTTGSHDIGGHLLLRLSERLSTTKHSIAHFH